MDRAHPWINPARYIIGQLTESVFNSGKKGSKLVLNVSVGHYLT